MHKARPARFLIFITIWSILVYDPVARWSWDPDGWSNKLGVMDFAGGTPVHIVSGTTVAAFAVFFAIETRRNFEEFLAVTGIFLRRLARRIRQPFQETWRTFLSIIELLAGRPGWLVDYERDPQPDERAVPVFEPYDVNYLVLGTALLWFGWAGFNGGSALAGNLRAVSAWTSTHTAACAGGTMGVFLIWVQKIIAPNPDQAFDNLTVFYFCDGAIAGLVAITPGAGYVSSPFAED